MNDEQIKEIVIKLIEQGELYIEGDSKETAAMIAKFVENLRIGTMIK
ncbi:hypothetical protein G8V03_09520 [Clostridium botulinum D/C]|nr:hypothetical protein [Clostridium botulinum]MCD3351226.1 hypothetical protein [Clostridium botulinum D/C]MCD3360183.1 hypothetical protein [Clostridium botulinum D/C]MCD3361714.1 hypothetical protein [Clostridium botulinum D/C]MCD3365988.1 hypothetical protein [Clostridium botulinum D/C]